MNRQASKVLGRWRIVEIEGWDTDDIDMLGPAHIQFDRDGGHVEFGAVQIGLDCGYSPTGVHFNFQGHDEMTEVSGDGDADLESDGSLKGEIRSTGATKCPSPHDVGQFPQPVNAA